MQFNYLLTLKIVRKRLQNADEHKLAAYNNKNC